MRELENFVAGLRDALIAWPHSVMLLYTSSTLRKLFSKCFILNGAIFLGSIAAFDWILLPLFSRILPDSEQITMTAHIASWLYHLTWLWPVYALSFVLNSIWYQEIADALFSVVVVDKRPKRPIVDFRDKVKAGPRRKTHVSLTQRITDEIYRNLLFLTIIIQSSIIYYILPFFYIGTVISFLQVSWLYAFYSFEYLWIGRRWPLTKRIGYFEDCWAYFTGFGMPSALLTFLVPQFIGNGVYALIFPVYILVSFVARPMIGERPVRVFAISRWLNLLIIRSVRSILPATKTFS